MLKFNISRKEFEAKYPSAVYVDLENVPKEKYLLTDGGECFKVERFDGTILRLAQLETKGCESSSGQYITHFPNNISIPTAKLVARHFVDGYAPGRDMLIYVDGNKLNVNADNLKWATYKEVMQNYFAKRKAKMDEGYVLESSRRKSKAIEEALAKEDEKLEFGGQKYIKRAQAAKQEAVWDEELKDWVVFSKEWPTEVIEDGCNYELSNKEEKAQEIKSNKQLRHAYKWGNGYDPEGEF